MKALNLFFWLGVFISIIMTVLFFFSWNNYKAVALPEFDEKIGLYSIDQCTLTDKFLSIHGWAVSEQDPKSKVRIYAKKMNGSEWVKVNYATQSRPDVSKFIGTYNAFDKSGFEGAIRNIKFLGGLSGDIAITMADTSGKVRGVMYECK